MYLIKPRKLHVIEVMYHCGCAQERHRLQGDSSQRSQPVNHNISKKDGIDRCKERESDGERRKWTDGVTDREIRQIR